jgi:transcriptional regulator with XRE-family HTH domain
MESGMEDAGQKFKRARERLNLRYRDVEEASLRIAERHKNDEFIIALSRLSDIENKGTLPTIYRLYSLCAIYRLNLNDVLRWYSVDPAGLTAESAGIRLGETHMVALAADGQDEATLPLALDPGFDIRKTTYLSRMIQKWGRFPLSLLDNLDIQNHRYAFIGSEDWTMYPLIPPNAFIMIDESKKKIVNTGWTSEWDRPIYFFEHHQGYVCGWCSLSDTQLVIQPHPASMCTPQVWVYPEQIEVVGQVSGVAMTLDPPKRHRGQI